MDKILISNSFKNLLQSLGAKTSNSNYAVPVVTAGSGTTAGTPQGYMDMASLASVLGGQQTHISTNSDLNDYVNCGVYQVDNSSDAKSITNSPYSNSGYSLIVIPSGSNRIQIIIANNGLAWYSRGNVSNEWKSWYKLEGTVIQQ